MRKAFTLIELLVVIAIISILAGMLMPALEKARQEARKAACISNVKNVGTYISIYRENHNGYPVVRPDLNGDGTREDGFRVSSDSPVYDSSLTIALLKNVGLAETDDVFTCPNTNDEELMDGYTVNASGSDPGITGGEVDWDSDTNTTEYRFASRISIDCDPSYLIDPNIPYNANPGRAIYADGPDLAKERKAAAAGEKDTIAEEYANHRRGAVTLFADSAARYLTMDNTGRTRNTRVSNPAEDEDDDDIYDDSDFYDDGDPADDDRFDCNLGNGFKEDTMVEYRLGPDWDRE